MPMRMAPPRPAVRGGVIRSSVLLVLSAVLLPFPLPPLSRLVPPLGMPADPLAERTATAATQVAALLARQTEALRRIEAAAAGAPPEAITALLAAEPALRGLRLRAEPAGAAAPPALLTGTWLRADPDPAA